MSKRKRISWRCKGGPEAKHRRVPHCFSVGGWHLPLLHLPEEGPGARRQVAGSHQRLTMLRSWNRAVLPLPGPVHFLKTGNNVLKRFSCKQCNYLSVQLGGTSVQRLFPFILMVHSHTHTHTPYIRAPLCVGFYTRPFLLHGLSLNEFSQQLCEQESLLFCRQGN